MALAYTGDPSDLDGHATRTQGAHTDLTGHLTTLKTAHVGLTAAVVSQHTGPAIDNAMQNTITSGHKLAGTLQDIIDQLRATGVNIGDQDMQGGSQINSAGSSKIDYTAI